MENKVCFVDFFLFCFSCIGSAERIRFKFCWESRYFRYFTFSLLLYVLAGKRKTVSTFVRPRRCDKMFINLSTFFIAQRERRRRHVTTVKQSKVKGSLTSQIMLIGKKNFERRRWLMQAHNVLCKNRKNYSSSDLWRVIW